jgi:glycosyltransferase involved in cell wall biosynthesis
MKGLPRCTITLPTYNRVAMLPSAVATVIAQNEPNFELIIIDDVDLTRRARGSHTR